MAKKERTYLERVPGYDSIKTKPLYWKYVKWLATPTPLRDPKIQKEFARVNKVGEVTLILWRKMPELFDDVRNEIKIGLKDDIPDVMYALKSKIFKDGDAREVKLFLEWVDEWTQKIAVEHGGSIPTETDDVIKKVVARFEDELFKSLAKKKDAKTQ